MNRIAYTRARTRFIDEAHGVILVDDVPLDQLIEAWWPGRSLEGLIPAFLTGLANTEEEAVIWARALPPLGERAVAPILLCPDDLDFYCTVVLAEVTHDATGVRWNRIGVAEGPSRTPADVGSAVNWCSSIPPLEFHRLAYAAMLRRFREAEPWYAPCAPLPREASS